MTPVHRPHVLAVDALGFDVDNTNLSTGDCVPGWLAVDGWGNTCTL